MMATTIISSMSVTATCRSGFGRIMFQSLHHRLSMVQISLPRTPPTLKEKSFRTMLSIAFTRTNQT